MVAHRHRVLHIEDHDDTRHAVEAFLRSHDFEVVGVDGARAGLRRLRDGLACCVILLDWRMPGMNGEGFQHEQMADKRLARIPVVVLTADPLATEDARHLGLRAVLRKPVEPVGLIGTLEQWLECGEDR